VHFFDMGDLAGAGAVHTDGAHTERGAEAGHLGTDRPESHHE
jgi:hypothetical protein